MPSQSPDNVRRLDVLVKAALPSQETHTGLEFAVPKDPSETPCVHGGTDSLQMAPAQHCCYSTSPWSIHKESEE